MTLRRRSFLSVTCSAFLAGCLEDEEEYVPEPETEAEEAVAEYYSSLLDGDIEATRELLYVGFTGEPASVPRTEEGAAITVEEIDERRPAEAVQDGVPEEELSDTRERLEEREEPEQKAVVYSSFSSTVEHGPDSDWDAEIYHLLMELDGDWVIAAEYEVDG